MHNPLVAARPDPPPLDFRIRPASVEDAGGIVDVWLTRHRGDHAASTKRIADEITLIAQGDGRVVMVAVHCGRVVAYGRARLWRPEEVAAYHSCPAGWWLSGAVVLPELRRQGLGTALMKRRLRDLNVIVHSRADVNNQASSTLHAACGFVAVTRDFTAPGTGNADEPMVQFEWTPNAADTGTGV